MIDQREPKERPILFSADMIRDILEGRKIQTRRVIKDIDKWDIGCLRDDRRIGKPIGEVEFFYYDDRGYTRIEPPLGRAGDRLWCKETWAIASWLQPVGDEIHRFEGVRYRATDSADGIIQWRSSIHMPRWASRLTLEITEVRVEQVREISHEDIVAEGLPYSLCIYADEEGYKDFDAIEHVDLFADLWDSINARRGYGWDANPWVWCISFRRLI